MTLARGRNGNVPKLGDEFDSTGARRQDQSADSELFRSDRQCQPPGEVRTDETSSVSERSACEAPAGHRSSMNSLTNLIYVVPERSNTDKYRILVDLIKCARNHRCINAVSVGINQV